MTARAPARRPPWRPRVHLPEGLDLAARIRPEWVPYGEWVVGAVVYQRFADHRSTPESYVPLSAKFANAHLSNRVRRPLLAGLLAGAVLECDGAFAYRPERPGEGKCFCYRLGPEFRGRRTVSKFITHPELLKKMVANLEAERAAVTHPTHRALRAWHDRVEVLPTAPAGAHPLLDAMIHGERRFSVCDQGRVHTNVCNLPRQFRQFIRLDGRELVSIDVAASQPLLLGLTIRETIAARRTHAPRPTRSHRAGGGPTPQTNRPPSCVHCWDRDLNDYLADCLAGRLYERLAAAIPGTPYTRERGARRVPRARPRALPPAGRVDVRGDP